MFLQSAIDMTVSSPVKAGLPVDLDDAVDEGRKAFGNWNPDAAGWKSAREAVVEYYRERGGNFTAGQIILTASTSEAYSVLFKTFCDPGDVILTPMPGYPLLDTLAQLEHLECAPYFLKIRREKKQRHSERSEESSKIWFPLCPGFRQLACRAGTCKNLVTRLAA